MPQGLSAYLVSVTLRMAAGGILAAAAAGSQQVSGPFAAFGLGVAAPLVVEKLSRTIPLRYPPDPESNSEVSERRPLASTGDHSGAASHPETRASGASDAR